MSAENNAIDDQIKDLYWTKKEPRKALQTFLRNQNKIYVNSFNIIDRKASIMINVNSTIISAIVIFSEKLNDIHLGEYIGVILVVSCFISLMSALNASRPNLFQQLFRISKQVASENGKVEENIFISNGPPLKRVSLKEFEMAFDKLVNSQELQIANQVKTMYQFNKQIKSSLLGIEVSFIAFMSGFTITVILFVLGELNLI